jgi:uroporphyrinogen decarboxylase
MGEMTPRERVETTLRHEEPDRVPLDIGGGNSTSLLVETYENLKEHLGKTAPTRIMNKAFRSAELDEDVMVRLGSDVRSVRTKAPKNWTPPPSEPDTFIDGFGITWHRTPYPGGYYWEIPEPPLAQATIADLEKSPWPDPTDPGFYEGLQEEIKDLYENTSYAIMGDSVIKGFWEPMFMLRGIEQSLMDLVINKDFVHALMERLFELNTAVTRRFLEITGPYLSVFRTADDMATQENLLMSPETYCEMIKPYHKRFNTFIKEYTDAKIFYHSCGNVVPLLDELIDAGFDLHGAVGQFILG